MSEAPTIALHGKRIDLDGQRYVAVSLCDERPNSVYIEFRNKEGESTKLVISAEARDALSHLLRVVRHQSDERWELFE